MTRAMANVIVGTYDALVKVQGKDYADKHYLAKGTGRYKANLQLLRQAKRTIAQASAAKRERQ